MRQSAKPTTTDESEFQSTHPSGVRPWSAAPLHLRHGFQSTHPSGVRLFWFAPSRPPNEFQSTHPSGVRPSMRTRKQKHNGISIHAPQWGATRRLPAQGLIPGDFNPRTPVGCDPSTTYQEDPDQISIHAPQWGATTTFRPPSRRGTNFNPRTPVGCDGTTRHGLAASRMNFNPRTPVGCDWLPGQLIEPD